jgi:hypothetical protein
MKPLLLIVCTATAFFSYSQTLYDFTNDPLANGWNYYDNYSSSPNAGFAYDPINDNIQYAMNTGTEISFLHTDLPYVLSKDFCVSFKITPTDASNYNTMFPLLLSPTEMTGTHLHPWRQNAINAWTAGPAQNLDLLGVEVMSNQIRFLHRNDNTLNSTTIQSFSTPFYMTTNVSYWIRMSVINTTTVELSVYNNASFTAPLVTQTFNIPVLDDMYHLYIANSNGNSNSTQYGKLDDYRINQCGSLNIKEEIISKKLVLYPNPTNNICTISLPSDHEMNSIDVLDNHGKVVFSKSIIPEDQAVAIDCSFLEPGIYFVTVKNNTNSILLKLVKN